MVLAKQLHATLPLLDADETLLSIAEFLALPQEVFQKTEIAEVDQAESDFKISQAVFLKVLKSLTMVARDATGYLTQISKRLAKDAEQEAKQQHKRLLAAAKGKAKAAAGVALKAEAKEDSIWTIDVSKWTAIEERERERERERDLHSCRR